MDKPLCPGHTNVCKFCKSEQGYYRFVGGFKEVTRQANGSTKPIIDPCCKACKGNMNYVKKHFDQLISAKFGYKIPKGDELK